VSRRPTVLVLAGEASGDSHAAGVVRELRGPLPHARFVGTGGPALAAEGVELLAELDRLAVMGFAEVVRHLPYFRVLLNTVTRLLRGGGIDLVLAVDYPGFNLRASRVAREAGVPVLYYVAPQVWAWNPRRARRLARDTRQVAVVLPFEAEALRASGAAATFVGHPLLDRGDDVPARDAFCTVAGLDPATPILALFPGSRPQEVERHLTVFAQAARIAASRRPPLQPVVARAAAIPPRLLAGAGFPVVDDGRALLRHARAALVKSGTATLEGALEGTPMVVAYRTHPLTFLLARRMVRVRQVALANLVAGAEAAPEYVQGRATPHALAAALDPLLADTPERERRVALLSGVRSALGTPGAARRVARMALDILGEAR
jgi:lipid-A-disaccharide synthase